MELWSPVIGTGVPHDCVLIPKPGKTWRFCTDYKKLNSVTKTDTFPIPQIDDCIFLRFSVSLTKSKMAAKILWRTLELEPLHRFVWLFGLKERPYSGRDLKSFWCDPDNKKL